MLTIKTLIKVFNKIFATFLRVYTKIIVRRREEQYINYEDWYQSRNSDESSLIIEAQLEQYLRGSLNILKYIT